MGLPDGCALSCTGNFTFNNTSYRGACIGCICDNVNTSQPTTIIEEEHDTSSRETPLIIAVTIVSVVAFFTIVFIIAFMVYMFYYKNKNVDMTMVR